MHLGKWVFAAGVSIMIVSAASTAHAQVVTFSGINDAVASRFFDAGRSAPSISNANRLILGLHTGMNWSVSKSTEFKASTAAYSYTTASDTISFTVKAPSGFYIAKITYSQRGTGSVLRSGKAAGAATWVVAGFSANLGTFSTNPTLSRTMDLTGRKMTVVPVTITNTLFAYATPSLGSATVRLTGADVLVQLLPLTD
jgi:hypothetical protein